jgi:nitroreductase/NAD-dependent dihydropyrimidine dehydrogenase PreA subunit
MLAEAGGSMSPFNVDQDKCGRDGLCIAECPLRILERERPEDFPSLIEGDEDLCIACGHCVVVCPHGAARLDAMKPEDCPPVRKDLLPGVEQVEHFLKSRRSVRIYDDRPVSREVLAKLIDVARYAPSGHNAQPVHWIVIEEKQEADRLAGLVVDWMRHAIQEKPSLAQPMHFDRIVASWEVGEDRILRQAPHVIVAHAPRSLGLTQTPCLIALTYLELAAYAMGLGACWAGYFNAAATSYPPMIEALQLPKGHQSFGAMMVGYPKHEFVRIPLRKDPQVVWR